ncbi:pyridoxamine 5'-phosphate oxidase family protein [Paenibacillus wynnii]|uniref:pyridoxamine 5'-phosphate oxidase family protein n=1 Tax=Paenibacillus wynnii TaxID=268407 RepID=UPI00068C45DB|nr:pyridoxamine 5'-phosphate oxidase family protein [Paenibacillus wynnii]
MRMTDEIKKLIGTLNPIPIATCDCEADEERKSSVNLIFVTFLKVYDDETLLIANNKFYKTMRNLNKNPNVSIALYNPDNNRSFQLKGKASVYLEGEIFEETVQWVQSGRPNINPQAAVLVHIEKIYSKAKRLVEQNGELTFVRGII